MHNKKIKNELTSFSQSLQLQPEDNRRLATLCGPYNSNLQKIAEYANVDISHRGYKFQITATTPQLGEIVCGLLNQFYAHTNQQTYLTPEYIQFALHEALPLEKTQQKAALPRNIIFNSKLKAIKTRTSNQQLYLDNIAAHLLNFGVGPAGTGKTYLAVASAVAALDAEHCKRILLVRPVVEAGERLGFLPGDIAQKVDPYFRPLYDALFEIVGFDKATKLIERQVIEIAPLAYMRGRTLSDAFIILDEAQNTTREQMKMFLTRIGFNSTVVITGDLTQIDLPKGQISGLRQAVVVLENVAGIGFAFFTTKDIVRHPMVQAIIDAYDNYQAPNSAPN